MILLLLTLACTGEPTADYEDAQADDDFGPAPSFQLTDQNGIVRTQADFAGKVWVANFIFTSCPDVCPLVTTKLAALQAQHPWATYVSFSVDPGTDTPPVLLAYSQRFHAQPGWYFLTGPVDDVRKVVVEGFKQAMEVTDMPAGTPDRILHGDRVVIIDKAGHMRGFPESQSPEVESILKKFR